MHTDTTNAYVEEVKYQTRMINNLKKWMVYCFAVSSIALVALITYSIYPFIRFISIALMVISVIVCVLIGYSVKKGQDNVNRILDMIQNK